MALGWATARLPHSHLVECPDRPGVCWGGHPCDPAPFGPGASVLCPGHGTHCPSLGTHCVLEIGISLFDVQSISRWVGWQAPVVLLLLPWAS